MDQRTSGPHRFGPFRYDPVLRVLSRQGRAVALEPKVVDTLEALLERRGEIVDKAELMRRVWPDCTVEEVGLSRNISILRKAIEDETYGFIETVPKRGYRFVQAAEADLEAAAEAPAMSPAAAPAVTADGSTAASTNADPTLVAPPPRTSRTLWRVALALLALSGFLYWQFYLPSPYLPNAGKAALVAVVPVECLSPALEQSAYATGLSSALVAELSRFQGLQLISPSTVNRYQRLGIPVPLMTRVLGVQVVVEGTAQVAADQLQVSLRLSDVHSGKLIWAQTFDQAASDLLPGQAKIARNAAAEISRLMHVSR